MISEVVLQKLRYTDYWQRPYDKWGVDTWNTYFNEKNDDASWRMSYNSLAAELKVLIDNLKPETREGEKALALSRQLKKSGRKSTEFQEKDKSSTVATYSLRKRKNIDYNENRMSKKKNEMKANDDRVYEEDVDIKKLFKEKYDNMKDEFKWKLSCTGRIVEDVIYESISNFKFEHLVHSFTIDVDDPIVKGIFLPVELDEIYLTNIKKELELSTELYESLANYYEKSSTDEIREVMKEADLGSCKFEIDTLKYSVHSLVRQYERNPSAFSLAQYEAWYNVNVWGPIIDRAYDDIVNFNVVRGESSSLASSDRKNRGRSNTYSRKEMGRRGDAIIRKSSGGIRLEFGGSEAGRNYEGQSGTKWINESGLKLPKMMRDMFVSLCENANWDMRKMEKMETVGYVHSGLVLMIMTLDLPAGYVTRLTKSELYHIPEDIESFGKVIELITAVWKSKMQVVRTMKILQRTEEDSFNHLKNVSTRKKCNHQTNKTRKVLPDNQMTPNKDKKKRLK